MNVKCLINRSFNIGHHIVTIRETNMNLGISQCKNCWKWNYTIFACHTHEAKCQKCNGLHKLEHHRKTAWCCKANFKTNPLRLKTKKGEPCIHLFKCSKCEHQADSNNCSFWKHRFNRDEHNKKLQELWEIRANSICSAVSRVKIWF